MILKLFHCTNTKALPKILRQGLRPMKRGHVCLSEDRDYAIGNGFAYFESQAAYLYRTKYSDELVGWSDCFKEAVGKKRKVVIEIELPLEKLTEESQHSYERFQERKEWGLKHHPDLVDVKMQELHALIIPPRYFRNIEVVL